MAAALRVTILLLLALSAESGLFSKKEPATAAIPGGGSWNETNAAVASGLANKENENPKKSKSFWPFKSKAAEEEVQEALAPVAAETKEATKGSFWNPFKSTANLTCYECKTDATTGGGGDCTEVTSETKTVTKCHSCVTSSKLSDDIDDGGVMVYSRECGTSKNPVLGCKKDPLDIKSIYTKSVCHCNESNCNKENLPIGNLECYSCRSDEVSKCVESLNETVAFKNIYKVQGCVACSKVVIPDVKAGKPNYIFRGCAHSFEGKKVCRNDSSRCEYQCKSSLCNSATSHFDRWYTEGLGFTAAAVLALLSMTAAAANE